MNKPQLKFGLKGLSAMIVFANGKESDIYESQQAILADLPGMVSKEKITQEEAAELFGEIMNSESLPIKESRGFDGNGLFESIFGTQGFPGIMVGLGGILGKSQELTMAAHIFGEEVLHPEVNTSTPNFKTCACGKHAMFIWNKNEQHLVTSTVLSNKKDARECLGHHAKSAGEAFTNEDNERLLEEINNCTLPETKEEKAKQPETAEPATVN